MNRSIVVPRTGENCSMMLQTSKSRTAKSSTSQSRGAIRVAAFALGFGLLSLHAIGPAFAADEEEDERTFEQGLIHSIMTGLGGTNMENRGINYRERSPLVVPPSLDLPPPETSQDVTNVPNWPKDPDEAERRRIIAASKQKEVTGNAGARALTPSELAVGKTRATRATEPVQPGATSSPMLSPAQLGYTGNIFGTLFGGNKSESKPFTGEPTRESLTQPPTGYQTPSSGHAYGTGPKESNRVYYDIMQGKEVKN